MSHLQDDFYILDSHLVVTETSNSILDSSVWKAVVPQSALSWQRVLVANWLSRDGADYAHWIKKHNSGESRLSADAGRWMSPLLQRLLLRGMLMRLPSLAAVLLASG